MKKKLLKLLLLCLITLTIGCHNDSEKTSGEQAENLETESNYNLNSGDAATAEDEAETVPSASVVSEEAIEFVEPAATDFEYKYDAALEGLTITRYNGEAEAIRIPAEIDGDPVKEVSFTSNSIIHIEFPDCITSIRMVGCRSLTEITIPNNVTKICLAKCSALTEIIIPDSVTSIEKSLADGAFAECSSLTQITIPDSVTNIGGYAFADCSSLAEITIPDSVTNIDEHAFADCSSLTEINIPNGITSIKMMAFDGCSSLTKITFQDNVTTIEPYAFSRCSSLTEITIPNSVTHIYGNAFENCTSLRYLTIPDSVQIDISAFHGCESLTVTYQGEEYNYANDPYHWWW